MKILYSNFLQQGSHSPRPLKNTGNVLPMLVSLWNLRWFLFIFINLTGRATETKGREDRGRLGEGREWQRSFIHQYTPPDAHNSQGWTRIDDLAAPQAGWLTGQIIFISEDGYQLLTIYLLLFRGSRRSGNRTDTGWGHTKADRTSFLVWKCQVTKPFEKPTSLNISLSCSQPTSPIPKCENARDLASWSRYLKPY